VLAEKASLDMAKVRIIPRESSGVPLGQTIGGAEVRITERPTDVAPSFCRECEQRDQVILSEARKAQRYRDALSAVAYEVDHVRKLIGESRTAQDQAAYAVAALSRLSALCEAMGVSS
jgi:hypothetical protein